MRTRALSFTVVVTAAVVVVGFVVLFVGAYAADDAIRVYRRDLGLPARDWFGRWTLVVAGYAFGAALSVLVIVFTVRWRRGVLFPALLAEIAIGLALAVDGLLKLTPTDSVADLVPSWYAPLSVAQGLGMMVVFGLAVMALPQPVESARF